MTVNGTNLQSIIPSITAQNGPRNSASTKDFSLGRHKAPQRSSDLTSQTSEANTEPTFAQHLRSVPTVPSSPLSESEIAQANVPQSPFHQIEQDSGILHPVIQGLENGGESALPGEFAPQGHLAYSLETTLAQQKNNLDEKNSGILQANKRLENTRSVVIVPGLDSTSPGVQRAVIPGALLNGESLTESTPKTTQRETNANSKPTVQAKVPTLLVGEYLNANDGNSVPPPKPSGLSFDFATPGTANLNHDGVESGQRASDGTYPEYSTEAERRERLIERATVPAGSQVHSSEFSPQGPYPETGVPIDRLHILANRSSVAKSVSSERNSIQAHALQDPGVPNHSEVRQSHSALGVSRTAQGPIARGDKTDGQSSLATRPSTAKTAADATQKITPERHDAVHRHGVAIVPETAPQDYVVDSEAKRLSSSRLGQGNSNSTVQKTHVDLSAQKPSGQSSFPSEPILDALQETSAKKTNAALDSGLARKVNSTPEFPSHPPAANVFHPIDTQSKTQRTAASVEGEIETRQGEGIDLPEITLEDTAEQEQNPDSNPRHREKRPATKPLGTGKQTTFHLPGASRLGVDEFASTLPNFEPATTSPIPESTRSESQHTEQAQQLVGNQSYQNPSDSSALPGFRFREVQSRTVSEVPASQNSINEAAPQVLAPLREQLTLRKDGTLHVDLYPKELGQVTIVVRHDVGGVTAQLLATEATTSELLATQQQALEESLANSGFDHVNVDIGNREENERNLTSKQDRKTVAREDASQENEEDTPEAKSDKSVSSNRLNIVA